MKKLSLIIFITLASQTTFAYNMGNLAIAYMMTKSNNNDAPNKQDPQAPAALEDYRKAAFTVVDQKLQECIDAKMDTCPVKFESKSLREFAADLGPTQYQKVEFSIQGKNVILGLKKLNACINEIMPVSKPIKGTDAYTIFKGEIVDICLGKEIMVRAYNKGYTRPENEIFTKSDRHVDPDYWTADMEEVTEQQKLLLSLREKGFTVDAQNVGINHVPARWIYFMDKTCEEKTAQEFRIGRDYSSCLKRAPNYTRFMIKDRR